MVKSPHKCRDTAGRVFTIILFASLIALKVWGVYHGTINYGNALLELSKTQPLLFGLASSVIVGAVTFILRYLVFSLWHQVFTSFYSSITICNTDESYKTILDFLTKFMDDTSTKSLNAETKKKKFSWKEWKKQANGLGTDAPEIDFRPDQSSGLTSIIYKGNFVYIYRVKGQTVVVGYEKRPLDLETLTLVSAAGTDFLQGLIREAVEMAYREEQDVLNIYTLSSSSWLGGWEKSVTKPLRPRNSVLLDDTLADDIINDVKTFLGRREWYNERGIPYRRGYLLYGAPGCGKTSFSQIIASQLNLNICVLNMSNPGLNDSVLAECMRDSPERSLLLLEDVDAIFVQRDRAGAKESTSNVSFSGLLNAIDGVASQEGRILLMTTNHLEKLDAALVRPGRCDVKIELRPASRKQLYEMFIRFFPGHEAQAENFSNKLPEYEVTMATLQGYMLEHVGRPEAALANVAQLVKHKGPIQVDPPVPIAAALRRTGLGLEIFAPIFHYHGYHTFESTENLDFNDVSKWAIEFSLDPVIRNALKKMLSRDRTYMSENLQLVDMNKVRDMFYTAYSAVVAPPAAAAVPDIPPLLIRRPSDGLCLTPKPSAADALELPSNPPTLRRIKSDEHMAAFLKLEQLMRSLTDVVVVRGKGVVSLAQIRHLIQLYPNDPEGCVCNARALLLGALPDEDSPLPRPLTTWQLLCRLGLPDLGPFVRQPYAHHLLACKDDDQYAPEITQKMKPRLQTLKRLLKPEPADMNLMREAWALLARPAIEKEALDAFRAGKKEESLKAYRDRLLFSLISEDEHNSEKNQLDVKPKEDGKKEEEEKGKEKEKEQEQKEQKSLSVSVHAVTDAEMVSLARRLSILLSSPEGHGYVSLRQLRRFLTRYAASPKDAVEKADSELLHPAYPDEYEAPARPPPPKLFVLDWLKDVLGDKAGRYGQYFQDASLTSKEDLVASPLLTVENLQSIGVKDLGIARKLQRALQTLAASPSA